MRGAFDVPVRYETSTSGLSLAVMSRRSWCAQKMESEALMSEAANKTAQAVQPSVAPERFPELPCPCCHCST